MLQFLMQQNPDQAPLPALRPDIQLNPGPPELEGPPTWTLYDPSANKYYKIGWLEFECLSRFKKCRNAADLVAAVSRETPLQPDGETIRALTAFLIHNNLVTAAGEGASSHFESLRAGKEHHWIMKGLHSYLFFTIPLVKPEKFLRKTFPYISFLFTRSFMTGVVLLLLYGIFLSVQRFDELFSTFMNYLTFEGVILFLISTVLVKIVHELGHAYTATKYGVPVTVMGVAFMVLYPVLYSETTNAWKMVNRRNRLNIAAAGMMAEMAVASVAIILWHFLDPGPLQSLCFMIGIVSLGASLAVNLNPLMRFDGYYLFSDIVQIDNLQDRSFAFVKWYLRRFLWGWDDSPPEYLPAHRQRFLALFGLVVCIYRFFLFVGIAILVYHVFFKPLGPILMMVELGFFIVLPILREIRVWVQRWEDISLKTRGGALLAILLLALLMTFVPVQRSVEIPAVLHAGSFSRLYPPIPAQLNEIKVKAGDHVAAGQVLFKLSSPDLDYNIALVSQRLRVLQEVRSSSQANRNLMRQRATIDSEIAAARQELDGYLEIREQMAVKAPHAGTVRDIDPSLHAGQWLSTDSSLALIVDDSAPVISGYVREGEAARVAAGAVGTFYPEFSPFRRIETEVKSVDQTALSNIYWPELASVHGGAVPAERDSAGGLRPLPRHTYYAARFSVAEGGQPFDSPEFIVRGTVRLETEPVRLSNVLIKKGLSVMFQESGF